MSKNYDMRDRDRVAAVCRVLRALHGLTQPEMADRMGITESTLRTIETQRNPSSTRYIYSITKAAGVDVSVYDTIVRIYDESLVVLGDRETSATAVGVEG